MSEKLEFYSNTNFTCDNCQGEFYNETAYSYATSLGKTTKISGSWLKNYIKFS